MTLRARRAHRDAMNEPRHGSSRSSTWPIVGLLLLSVVPTMAGAHRLAMIASVVAPGSDASRLLAAAPMLATHIVSACTFAIVGAFQLSPSLRAKYTKAHARAGTLAVPMGLVSALSGLWLTMTVAPGPYDGQALFVMRVVVGITMVLELSLGVVALQRRRYLAHGAWMVRAYALGLGAGTQVLTHLPLFLVEGAITESSRAVAMGAGWLVNAIVAEWVVRARWNVPERVRLYRKVGAAADAPRTSCGLLRRIEGSRPRGR